MGLDNLYSPWRSQYFATKHKSECVFCGISTLTNKDKENYVFYRDSVCFGVMNLYPYTPGHFMLIPHKHVDSPTLLDENEWLHISKLSQKALELIEEYGANGINMGMNIKQAAGAGIPKHLHLHFIPRFHGDTNFITSIGNSRVYGVDFEKIFDKISSLAKKYLGGNVV